MTKYQEDEFYAMHEELTRDQKLNTVFHESLVEIKGTPKYKHRSFFDQYRVSFDKAKSVLATKS